MERITSMVRGYLEGIIIHDDLERKRLDELLSMDINDITGEKIIESIFQLNNLNYKNNYNTNNDCEFESEYGFVSNLLSMLEDLYFQKMNITEQMNTQYVFKLIDVNNGKYRLRYMYDNYDKFVKSKNNTINSTIFVNNIIKITEKYRRNLTTKDFQEIFRLYSNLDLDEVTFLRVLPEFLEIRDSISGGILGLDLFKILLDNLSKTYNTIEIYNIYRNTTDFVYVDVKTYINKKIENEKKSLFFKEDIITLNDLNVINTLYERLETELRCLTENYIRQNHKIFIINENEFLIDNIVFKDNLNKRIDDFIFVIKFKYDNLKK